MENKKVNWYPGHMFKAKKEIEEKLKAVDAVVEVVDARVPLSSHNEMLEKITRNKPKLVLFSKVDLVKSSELSKYEQYYQQKGYVTVRSNILNNTFRDKIISAIEEVCVDIRTKYQKKGINRSLRILVMGMPNVGKSSLINLLASKKKTEVGNKPGVTKQQQVIKISENIELLDTPGILIPKIERLEMGYNLVLNSLIKDEVVEMEDIGHYLLQFLCREEYRKQLKDRYKTLSLKAIEDFVSDDGDPAFVEQIYAEIGNGIGANTGKSGPQYDKITIRLINDYRHRKFGKIILDELNV